MRAANSIGSAWPMRRAYTVRFASSWRRVCSAWDRARLPFSCSPTIRPPLQGANKPTQPRHAASGARAMLSAGYGVGRTRPRPAGPAPTAELRLWRRPLMALDRVCVLQTQRCLQSILFHQNWQYCAKVIKQSKAASISNSFEHLVTVAFRPEAVISSPVHDAFEPVLWGSNRPVETIARVYCRGSFYLLGVP
jgi:hypothetical protein